LRARVESDWPDGQEALPEEVEDSGTMRSWLVRGTRKLAVDPRRRFGRHGVARRLLAGGQVRGSAVGAWRDLVSALQRHTVHTELAQLSKQDRQILSLAYLQGHTNSEIAAMLQVSARTVSRRLTAALARLEESAKGAAAGLSALALLALAGYSRWVATARSTRWPGAAAMAAAGTATAVAVGFAIANPAPSETAHASAPMSANAIHVSLPVQRPLIPISAAPTAVVVAPDQDAAKDHAGNGPQHAANQASVTASRICQGNPTSAPPAVPVGPRAGHPHEPPVMHPGPGGCGHKA